MIKKFTNLSSSPLGTVIKVALVILGGEYTIMLAIEGLFKPAFDQEVSATFWEFIDPIVLTIIVAPVLQVYVLHPMREQQRLLERQKDELGIAAVTFNAQEGVIVTDINHQILKVNHAFTEVTGYTADEAIGKTPALLSSGRQDKEFYRRMRERLAQDKHWQGEIWNRRKNGEIYPEWLTITAVEGEKGHIYYVGIFSDITQRKAAEGKINFMAYHDQLTALPNRELFYDRLSLAMSMTRRNHAQLALMYLDLDGFKPINDSLGHKAGDEVLRTTAKRLLACVRDVDTVARMGGDEFAIVLGGIEKQSDVTKVAEKIIKTLNDPIHVHDGRDCRIGVSIGIAISPDDGAEIDSLMSAADSAMYSSKSGKKNTFAFFKKEAQDHSESQAWIVLDDAHLLGISEMDQQHLALVRVLNELNGSVSKNQSTEEMPQLFDDLMVLVHDHFEKEEEIMSKHGFTDSDTHRHEHQRIMQELSHLREKFVQGGEMLVLQLVKEWLLNHVLDMDRQVADFLKQQGVT